MKEANNEFIEDTDRTEKRLARVRFVLYLVISGLVMGLLVIYS